MLVIGAAYGRIGGLIVNDLFPGANVDPGIYSVLGAASFMGGVGRMTVSLVVIMIEITDDLDALLPIMLVCMVSKWVGDMFCHSIYDEQLHFNNIPFLEPDAPKLVSFYSVLLLTSMKAATMLSHEAMQTDVVYLPEVASAADCAKALSAMQFSSIPVVETGKDGTKKYLKGSIPRTHLALLLYQRTFEKNNTLVDVMASERRFKKTMPDFVFSEEDGKKLLELGPYVNMATYWVYENFPLRIFTTITGLMLYCLLGSDIAYKIFRDNGLRQLFVVDYQFQLKGMITRKDLLVHEKHGVEHHQKSVPSSPHAPSKDKSSSFRNLPFRASSTNLRASVTRQASSSTLNVKPSPTVVALNLRASESRTPPSSPKNTPTVELDISEKEE
jgi:chloride channel 7